jgi:hypothetical protein
MSDPVSLRNIPADALHLAQTLSVQTGISISAIFRLALVSGILVECTRVGPDPQGRYAGREAAWLAKALRRHLGSAIDLLIEQGQHPYQAMGNTTGVASGSLPIQSVASSQQNTYIRKETEERVVFDHALEEDLDLLGIGLGLSELQGGTERAKSDA